MRWDLVRQWLAKAEEDLAAGGAILAASMPSFGSASFHAQQAAEKSLKALLVRHEITFSRTHDVGELLRLAEPVAPGISQELAQAEILTLHAVDTRYPMGAAPVARDEAARDLAAARQVVAQVGRLLRPFLDAGCPGS